MRTMEGAQRCGDDEDVDVTIVDNRDAAEQQ